MFDAFHFTYIVRNVAGLVGNLGVVDITIFFIIGPLLVAQGISKKRKHSVGCCLAAWESCVQSAGVAYKTFTVAAQDFGFRIFER